MSLVAAFGTTGGIVWWAAATLHYSVTYGNIWMRQNVAGFHELTDRANASPQRSGASNAWSGTCVPCLTRKSPRPSRPSARRERPPPSRRSSSFVADGGPVRQGAPCAVRRNRPRSRGVNRPRRAHESASRAPRAALAPRHTDPPHRPRGAERQQARVPQSPRQATSLRHNPVHATQAAGRRSRAARLPIQFPRLAPEETNHHPRAVVDRGPRSSGHTPRRSRVRAVATLRAPAPADG